MTPSEQQIAKQKLRREFAERIARLPHPIVRTTEQVKSIEVLMEDWMNTHLDLICMMYRDKQK